MQTINYDWEQQPIVDHRGYIEAINHDVIMVDDNYLEPLYQYLKQNGYQSSILKRKNTLDVFDNVIELFDDAIGIDHFHISNPYQLPSYLNDSTKVTYQKFKSINNQT